ncbi:MAG: SSI family serine proteinase inhibitor [Gaiellaceae bacterium]
MRIAILLVAAAAMTAGCAGLSSGRSGTTTSVSPAADAALEIDVRHRGTDGPVRSWTLRCPPGGTLPAPERACSRLDAMGTDAFRPIPRNVACAELYGGPQVAEVNGTFEGRPIRARFSRTNACEIDRWERHKFLFPVGT